MSDWQAFDFSYIYSGAAGILGRLMFHSRQVQRGKRNPLTWTLLFDLPIGLGMGWTALGVGVWLGLPQQVSVSLGIAFGHLGPVAIDRAFDAVTLRYLGKDKADAE
jgi:hypothetical protein